MLLAVGRVELDITRRDDEAAALGHGVAGIDGEVDDDLFELAWVDLHRAEFGALRELERDVLADEALEHFAQVADQFV